MLFHIIQEAWSSPSLENVAIIGAQHIMESIHELFSHLREKNKLNPLNVFLIGKCYSTSKSVSEEMRQEGFHVSDRSFYYDSHSPFDEFYQMQVEAFCNEALNSLELSGIEKLIILDDGGYLIRHFSELNRNDLPPIVGIEQTSAGYQYLKENSMKFPVINVARSKVKLEYEAPYIAESCLKRLEELSTESIEKKNVLVLGNGALGKEIVRYLSGKSMISTYDPVENTEKELMKALGLADFVIGCSGKTSLPYTQYKHLKKGAKLVSVSSSDREFDAHHFRREFPKHNEISQTLLKSDITIFNSGFPINFWGSRMNMPMKHIQITLALLMCGVFQAKQTTSQEGAFLTLDEVSQQKIITQKSVELWEQNAENWIELTNQGKDLYRDHVCTPGFFSTLPEVKGKSGLDIACGDGHFTRLLAQRGAKMIGIDLCQNFLTYARQREQTEQLDIQYQTANALNLQFADNAFDFATCFFALIDIANYEKALREAYRVIKPGGFFQFAIPHPCTWVPDLDWKNDEKGEKVAAICGGYFSPISGQLNEWLFEGVDSSKHPSFRSIYYRRTLSQWVQALSNAQFTIEAFEEPHCESSEALEKHPLLGGANIVPIILIIRCRKI